MATIESLHLAAQAWCTPETGKIVMDEKLAFAFATILDTAREAATEQAQANCLEWIMAEARDCGCADRIRQHLPPAGG